MPPRQSSRAATATKATKAAPAVAEKPAASKAKATKATKATKDVIDEEAVADEPAKATKSTRAAKATNATTKAKGNTTATERPKRAPKPAAIEDVTEEPKKTKKTKEIAATEGSKRTVKAATGAKRGRPKKTDVESATEDEKPKRATKAATGKKPGRPKKADAEAATAAKAAPKAAAKTGTKRKAAEEPAATTTKKAKAAQPKVAKTKAEVKPKVPGRRGGVKGAIINEIRYTDTHDVYVFGEGSSGELGLGASKRAIDVKRPRYNELLSNAGVVRIASGGMHVLALTKDNRILTWGVNDNGALGRDTSNADVKMRDVDDEDSDSDDEDSGLNEAEATPAAISMEHFPADTIFVDVVAGDSCSFALTDEGLVYGWGTFRKNEGVLGFTKDVDTARTPMLIEPLRKVTQLACGANHVIALDTLNTVWAWGSGQQNQLGRRVTERAMTDALVPTHIGFTDHSIKRPSKKMAHIFSGEYHSFSVGTDGHVWSWGANNYGETGHPESAGTDNATVATASIVHALEGRNVTDLQGGSHHNVAITANGDALVWGRCDGAQLGIPLDKLTQLNDDQVLKGDGGQPKVLVEPTVLPSLQSVANVACGSDHTIAVTTNGRAYSWGFSGTYQTGLGTDDDVDVPTLIDNTAVRGKHLVFAGAGGQYGLLCGARQEAALNGNATAASTQAAPNGTSAKAESSAATLALPNGTSTKARSPAPQTEVTSKPISAKAKSPAPASAPVEADTPTVNGNTSNSAIGPTESPADFAPAFTSTPRADHDLMDVSEA